MLLGSLVAIFIVLASIYKELLRINEQLAIIIEKMFVNKVSPQ